MIVLFIIVNICLSQIFEVDLENSGMWTKRVSYCENCTFKVSKTDKMFIQASVTLSESNDNLFLVADQFIVSDLNSQTFQGRNIDILNMIEKKKTRFLIIPTIVQPIYITIIDATANSIANVTISESSSFLCENNCTNNGFCISEIGCVCNEGYVGNICEISAQEIKEGTNTLQNNETYLFFYINFNKYAGQSVRFEFSTNMESNISVIERRYSEYQIPVSQDEEILDQYGEYTIDYFNNESSFTFQINIGDEGAYTKDNFYDTGYPLNYVLTAISNDKINFNLQFTVVHEDDSSSTTTIILATTIPISIILIIILAICLKKYSQRKRQFQQRREVSYQAPEIKKKKPKKSKKSSTPNINLKQSTEIQESCSICLEILKNGKNISYTVCSHQFHQECIEAWSQKHSICPLCRTNLVVNQIEL